MGIGFVIFIWAILFFVLGIIYASLWYLSKKNYIFSVIKDAFLGLAGAFVFLIIAAIFLGLLNLTLDSVIPNRMANRVFTESFGFAPNSNIKNLKGSQNFFSFDNSKTLTFETDKNTLSEITIGHFSEISKSNFEQDTNPNLKEFINGSQSHFFTGGNNFDNKSGYNVKFLAYDEETGKVYYSCERLDD